MSGGLIKKTLSRRRAVQVLSTLAAVAVVPLARVAAAQSTSSAESDNGNDNQASTNTPSQPANSTQGQPFNRFGPAPAPSPSPAPTTNSTAPASSSNQSLPANAKWVQNHVETEMWSGPDSKAISFGWVPAFSYFSLVGTQEGPRLRVQNPLTNGVAFLNVKDVGPSGAPPDWYLAAKNQKVIPSRVVGGANVRSAPALDDGNIIGKKVHNESIDVLGQVTGSDGEMWYRTGPREFIHGSLVRTPTPFQPHPGKLIVAELTEPCIVTAYEDGKAVYAALSLKGTVNWGTPTGFFTILRRVANETMSSETLGIPRDGPGGYYLKDVLYTQYFTNDGASIHYNYWSSNWGYSGSHGCLGMNYDDASFYWEWCEVGTPLVIKD